MSSDHEWRPGLVWIGLDWIVFSRLVLPCVSICSYQGTCESTNNSPDEVLLQVMVVGDIREALRGKKKTIALTSMKKRRGGRT